MKQLTYLLLLILVFAFAMAGLLPIPKYDPSLIPSPAPLLNSQIVSTDKASQNNLQIQSFGVIGTQACQPGGKVAVDFLLDTSTSMRKENSQDKSHPKIDSLKKAVADLTGKLNDNDLVGFQTFQNEHQDVGALKDVRQNFLNEINSLVPKDGTPSKKGMSKAKAAIEQAKAKYSSGYNWYLVFLTDGCPDGKNEDPRSVANEIKSMGVSVVGIGIELGGAGKCDSFGGVKGANQMMSEVVSNPAFYTPADAVDLDSKLQSIFSSANVCNTQTLVTNPTTCTRKNPPATVMLLDTSGSMEKHIDNLRVGVSNFIDNLALQNILGIFDYSSPTPKRPDPIRTLLPIDTLSNNQRRLATLNSQIDFNTEGKTHMKDAMSAVKVKIDDYKRTGQSDIAMIFTSDGVPETKDKTPDPAQDPSSVASLIKDEGVQLYTIAVGDKAGKKLLQDIASPGKFYDATDSKELGTIFDRIYDKLSCQ